MFRKIRFYMIGDRAARPGTKSRRSGGLVGVRSRELFGSNATMVLDEDDDSFGNARSNRPLQPTRGGRTVINGTLNAPHAAERQVVRLHRNT